MKINFKPFAFVLGGMCLIGISIGYILGYYIHTYTQTSIWMYVAAPLLGLGSGFVVYGTLYGRDKNNEK